jgi:hypothetical protein
MLPLNRHTKRKWSAIVFMGMTLLTGLFSFTGPEKKNDPVTPHFTKNSIANSPELKAAIPPSLFDSKKDLYTKLCLEDMGLSRKVFEMALKGMEKLLRTEKIRQHILSIADFSKPSHIKRLFVIDLDMEEILFHTWVAHGRNSGTTFANSFSNHPRSHKSSLGFYVTGNSYNGSRGYSLKLDGVEPGINNNALSRGIVVHGADYVGGDIAENGLIGRSWGCPAVAPDINTPLINTIKEGSCFFIYHPTNNYAYRSKIAR